MAGDSRLWFKVDVGYLDNPKMNLLLDEHPRAIILHLFCIGYAKQHGTNGIVPMRLAMRRACAEHSDLHACMHLGILTQHDDDHVMIKDYVKHQGSADADQTRSDKARHAAQARWGALDDDAQRNASSIAQRNAPSNADREIERKNTAASDDAFETWWQHYPKKVGKGDVRKAHKKAAAKISEDELTAAVVAMAAHHQRAGTEVRYIPNPSTWLNQERWNDELGDTGPKSNGRTVTDADGQAWDLGEWG